jgi:hypothetical protein
LVPTLNCYSIQLPHKFRHLHWWTGFCTPLLKKVTGKPFNQSCALSFVFRTLLGLWLTKNFFRCRNCEPSIFSVIFIQSSTTKKGASFVPRHPYYSYLFEQQTQFPHIPFIHCALQRSAPEMLLYKHSLHLKIVSMATLHR